MLQKEYEQKKNERKESERKENVGKGKKIVSVQTEKESVEKKRKQK